MSTFKWLFASVALSLLAVGGIAAPCGNPGQIQTNGGSGHCAAISAPAGAIVGTSDTQTLTNKTISGSSNTISNLSVAQGGTGAAVYGNGVLNAYLGVREVAIGDSITAGATSNIDSATVAGVNQSYGQSFANYAAFLSGGRVRLVHNAGIGGNTTTQMLARWQTSVANFNPDLVSIMAGTNDATANNLSLTEGNIKSMVQLAQAQGATVLLHTVPPAATAVTNPTQYAFLLSLNSWERSFAAQNRIMLADDFKNLVDPVTGGYKCLYNLSLTATGGTYTMTLTPWQVGGVYSASPFNITSPVTTGSIAYNATAAQVQTALDGASTGKIKMFVTGPTGGPYVIHNADSYPFIISTNTGGLTGGTATIVNGLQLGQDGTHPSPEGQITMAQLDADLFKKLFPSTAITGEITDNNVDHLGLYGFSVTDSANLIQNSCFTNFSSPGDTTGTLQTYVNPNSQTWKYVQQTDVCGNLINVSTTFGAGYLINGSQNITPSSGPGYHDGDVLAFTGKIQSAGFEQSNTVNLGSNTQSPQFGITLNVQATSGNYNFSPVEWGYDGEGTFYGETTLPVGTTNIYVTAFGGGTNMQQVRISELSLIDLTTFAAGN